MSSAQVGVVIPTYNGSRVLRATLASVAAQTMGDFACCIVDDGSTDGSADLARDLVSGDSRFAVLRQEQAGASAARNRGLASLPPSVEYVTFLDHDDLWEPHAVAELLRAAQHDRRLVGAHGLGRFIGAGDEPLQIGTFEEFGRNRTGCAGGRCRPWPAGAPTTFETLALRCTVFPPGLVLAQRAAYERLGGFDVSLRNAEDWDMLIRLARLGDFAFLDQVVIGYRHLQGGKSNDPEVMRRANARIRRKAYWSAENTPEQQRVLRDASRAVELLHARGRAERARQALSERRLAAAAGEAGRIILASLRYARGHPGRSGA